MADANQGAQAQRFHLHSADRPPGQQHVGRTGEDRARDPGQEQRPRHSNARGKALRGASRAPSAGRGRPGARPTSTRRALWAKRRACPAPGARLGKRSRARSRQSVSGRPFSRISPTGGLHIVYHPADNETMPLMPGLEYRSSTGSVGRRPRTLVHSKYFLSVRFRTPARRTRPRATVIHPVRSSTA